MIIAIPSKGRAGKTTSQKVLDTATFFVPEMEIAAYLSAGIKNVVPVPMEVRGITKTRNWILKNCGEIEVVFVDDDLKIQGFIEFMERNGKQKRLDGAEWMGEFRKLFELCEGLGYKIWGVSTNGARRAVYPYKPILFYSYVTASCMGIINDGEFYFDESFEVKEDYELCLRHIKEKGGILAARYLFWENHHWGTPGGCKDYRTQGMEADAIKRLIKMYPGMIRKIKRGGSEYSIELDF